ncbi:lipid-binding protein [Stygiomarasmius scandens]|uniref:Lipid-binding protein n=1 Tax=Marasmiellus scandens TaxID=2682957 RepID=A0ABR1JWY1_9AGAR
MPVPSFLTSIADKATNFAGQHLPSQARPTSPDSATQPPANQAAQGQSAAHKSHAFEAIQHQIRAFGQQYGSTSPVQKIITAEKGVSLDYDSVARDAKAQSKELYTWGQTEDEDLKDVTDRLAYLNFVHGSLSSSLATKLDAARAPLKALRDAETALAPRRNVRAGLQTQLARLEHDNQRGMEKKMAELKDQIKKAEADDASQEKEVELLKRKGIRESEQLKWEAIREYGEKLVLLSQAAFPVCSALPAVPPSESNPYTGSQVTGAARASLQRALDNYKTGHINLPPQSAASDLSRSDTRSFGESHASELSSISSDATHPGIPVTPPPHLQSSKIADVTSSPPMKSSSSPPINPLNLNQSPAPIPTSSVSSTSVPSTTSPVPISAPDPKKPISVLPGITPSVAETGVPISAGASGPGPASGSLHDVKAASPTASPRSGGVAVSEATPSFGQAASSGSKWESAEDEKKRLAAGYSQAYNDGTAATPSGSGTAAPHYESAEEEKKRLEREERERLLRGEPAPGPSKEENKKGDDEDLPPYQDI